MLKNLRQTLPVSLSRHRLATPNIFVNSLIEIWRKRNFVATWVKYRDTFTGVSRGTNLSEGLCLRCSEKWVYSEATWASESAHFKLLPYCNCILPKPSLTCFQVCLVKMLPTTSVENGTESVEPSSSPNTLLHVQPTASTEPGLPIPQNRSKIGVASAKKMNSQLWER